MSLYINWFNSTINIKTYQVFPSQVTANTFLYFVEYFRNRNNWESLKLVSGILLSSFCWLLIHLTLLNIINLGLFCQNKVVLSLLPVDAHSVNSQMDTEELQIVIPCLKWNQFHPLLLPSCCSSRGNYDCSIYCSCLELDTRG